MERLNQTNIALVEMKINELCNDMEDCKDNECIMKHPKLVLGYCVKNLKNECFAGEDGCFEGKQHKNWNTLLNIVKRKPELLQDFKKDKKYAYLYKFKKFVTESQKRRLKSIQQPDIDRLEKDAVEIKMRQNCDLLLVMDTTRSMAEWINEAKKRFTDIIELFKKKYRKYKLRVGFVGYKDFGDEGHLDHIDFTDDYEEVLKLVTRQEAKGGGDIPEDIIGALKLAMPPSEDEKEEEKSDNFTYGLNHTCCVVLIGDAPSHGNQYHSSSIKDSHPNIPENTLENIMKRYNQRPNLFFVAIKLTNQCDQMYERMKIGFPNLHLTNSENPLDLFNIVSNSIEKSITHQFLPPEEIPTTEVHITNDFFKNLKTRKTTMILPQLASPESMNELYWKTIFNEISLKDDEGVILKIQEQIPRSGQENWVIFAEDQKNKVALKIPKQIPVENGTPFYNQFEKVSNQIKNQTYAYMMATYFRKLTATNLHAPNLYYLKPIMYTLEEPINGIKYLYGELKIEDMDSQRQDFQRYTNNLSFAGNELIAAFSHFTFDASEGYFMVTDLQGKDNILSDPAIHSKDKKEFTSRTNFGEKGYAAFFTTQHKNCIKEICGALGLKRPEWDPFNPEFEERVEPIKPRPTDIVKMLCEKCAKIKDIQFNEYKEFFNDRDDTMCIRCHRMNEGLEDEEDEDETE